MAPTRVRPTPHSTSSMLMCSAEVTDSISSISSIGKTVRGPVVVASTGAGQVPSSSDRFLVAMEKLLYPLKPIYMAPTCGLSQPGAVNHMTSPSENIFSTSQPHALCPSPIHEI